jgi:hypothetical protein
MDSVIGQYEIPPPQKASWRKRLLLFFPLLAFVFAFRWIIEEALHWEHRRFPEVLIFPVVFAAMYAFRFPRTGAIGGSVIIGADFVEGRTYSLWFTSKKRIYRNRIRSISENRAGICVMDRGRFAARMLGFVFVPTRTPEYEKIKARLLQWVPSKIVVNEAMTLDSKNTISLLAE